MIKYPKNKSGFTLLELLIVIGILAILSITVLVVINPANLLMKARDGRRVSELNALNKGINFFIVSLANGSTGSSQTVYISLPDTNSDCSTYSLPSLPSPWIYHCVTQANLTKVDSNGWVPINFSSLDTGSPVSHLPIDPVNNSSLYYTYTTGGSFELTSLLENPDHHNAAINDGGPNVGVFEIGTHLGLTPSTRDLGLVGYWTMDDNAANTTVIGSSIEGNTGTFSDANGNPYTSAHSVTGQVNRALEFDGVDDYVRTIRDSDYSINNFTVELWFQTTDTDKLFCALNLRNIGFSGNSTMVGFRMSGVFSFRDNDGNGLNVAYPTSINDGKWHHFVAVKEGNEGRLYIDGEFYNYGTGSELDNYEFGDFALGLDQYGGGRNYWEGLIDEVRIYNRALSAEEIQARYNATK